MQGEETPSESESSGEDEGDEEEDEGELIFPRAPPPENLPSPGDLFGRHMGALTSARQVKLPWADASGASSLLLQPGLALVCSTLLGMSACSTGAWMTYLHGALQIPLSSMMVGAIVSVIAGSSSIQ
jgi:hypothetical protein